MMCASRKDPCLCSCCQIRHRSPERTSYRKLRHWFLCFFTLYIIDDQSETVSQIYKRGGNGRTCFGSKHKSCRILSVPHGKRANLNADFSIGNARTNFQHMRLQNSFSAGHQIVCIIFHKGGSLCIPDPCCHDLHKTDHRGCFPVAFRSKSVAFFHQALHCQSRKLLQSSQITEMCHYCLIIIFFQEAFKTDLNTCLNCHMTSEFFRVSSLKKNIIFIIIFFY